MLTTTGRPSVKTRNWASLAAGLALVGALSACSVFSVGETQRPYDPSDGVRVAVGDVQLLNLLVITEDGQDGNLLGSANNASDEDIDVTLQYESAGEKQDVTFEVPARTTLHFGQGEEGQFLLPAIDALPGSVLAVYVQYGTTPGKQIDVPVLDNRLPEYSELLPTPTPTPTPTVTADPESTEPETTETPAP